MGRQRRRWRRQAVLIGAALVTLVGVLTVSSRWGAGDRLDLVEASIGSACGEVIRHDQMLGIGFVENDPSRDECLPAVRTGLVRAGWTPQAADDVLRAHTASARFTGLLAHKEDVDVPAADGGHLRITTVAIFDCERSLINPDRGAWSAGFSTDLLLHSPCDGLEYRVG